MEKTIQMQEQSCNACGADDAEVMGCGIDFEYSTCDNEFSYVACRQCGHWYLNPQPCPAELDVIYPANYGNYAADRDQALTFKVKTYLDKKQIAGLVKGCKVERILDVGCADGRLLNVCQELFPDATAIEGVEISETAAAVAQERGHTVYIGTIDSMDLKADYYDMIFLQQVIEHVYDPAAVVKKLYGALRSGGQVCIETPTSEALDCRLAKKRYWGGYHFPRHFNIFNQDTLGAICRQAGFEVVRTGYRSQPVHWAWTMHHWLMEKGVSPKIYEQFNIRNSAVLAAFTGVEILAKLFTRRTSNMQLLVRKP